MYLDWKTFSLQYFGIWYIKTEISFHYYDNFQIAFTVIDFAFTKYWTFKLFYH